MVNQTRAGECLCSRRGRRSLLRAEGKMHVRIMIRTNPVLCSSAYANDVRANRSDFQAAGVEIVPGTICKSLRDLQNELGTMKNVRWSTKHELASVCARGEADEVCFEPREKCTFEICNLGVRPAGLTPKFIHKLSRPSL